MLRKTKIICTLGPATDSEAAIGGLVGAGANVFRLNMSHARHDWVRDVVARIRSACAAAGREVAILMDLQGPSIRTSALAEPFQLLPGDRVEFFFGEALPTTPVAVTANYDFSGDVAEGNTVLVDNGVMHLRVDTISPGRILTTVLTEGELGSRRHVNLPGVRVGLPALTDKDRADIGLAGEMAVDFVAMSFVRSAQHILDLKVLLAENGSAARVVAKIEDQEAVANLDGIIDTADAVMVARGDLGIECHLEELPIIQRKIIQKCIAIGRPVIVATHMLESMTSSPVPTRAEVTDVANAAFEEADAVMLSGETSVGDYPVRCVEALDRIVRRTEAEGGADYAAAAVLISDKQKTARAAVDLANALDDPTKLLVFTQHGTMAHHVAHFRPRRAPIFAFCARKDVARTLHLSRAVAPFLMEEFLEDEPDRSIRAAIATLRECGLVEAGDRLVILSDVLLKTAEGDERVSSILLREV